MAGYLSRGLLIVRDTVQMVSIHVGRITGVLGDAVTRAGKEVTDMVLDCRDVAQTGLRSESDSIDLSRDVGPVDIRPRDGSSSR